MNKPIRVELLRKKGWKMPPNTIKVTRPSKWGNPFRIGGYFMIGDPRPDSPFRMSWCEAMPAYADSNFVWIENAAMAVDFFRRLMATGYHKDLSALRGKNLACWCKLGHPCHADVLLELANK